MTAVALPACRAGDSGRYRLHPGNLRVFFPVQQRCRGFPSLTEALPDGFLPTAGLERVADELPQSDHGQLFAMQALHTSSSKGGECVRRSTSVLKERNLKDENCSMSHTAPGSGLPKTRPGDSSTQRVRTERVSGQVSAMHAPFPPEIGISDRDRSIGRVRYRYMLRNGVPTVLPPGNS